MFFFHCAFAQTPNSVPANGKVGIGTMTPNAKLQVKGCVKIDSSLTVNKSITVKENAAMKGNATFTGNVYLPTLVDTALTTSGVLMIDSTGKVVNGGALSSILYEVPKNTPSHCVEDGNGNPFYVPPIWQHENHGMFLLEQACHYSPRLGIGVKPSARVQIRNLDTVIKPLLIEQEINNEVHPLLQLDAIGNLTLRNLTHPVLKITSNGALILSNGTRTILKVNNSGKNTLHARRIVVDQNTWPDYVFDSKYTLISLRKLDAYIK